MFPVSLSEKCDLNEFAAKLCSRATLCTVSDEEGITAMVAGYTEHTADNMGYISIVATLPKAQRKQHGSTLIRKFLQIAGDKGLSAVHLYAVPTNLPAMRMYEKLGFVRFQMPDEPRPEDAHLIYYMH